LNKNFKVRDNKNIDNQEMNNTDTGNINNIKYIYFDHAATTPVLPEVVQVVNECFTKFYGNASEPHLPGRRAKEILESSRQAVAQVLGAKESEITFTGGGTESDNLAYNHF
jgi:cysteine desulfurase